MTPVDPVLFTIGNFEIRYYSVLILIGVVLAYILITSEAKKFQYKSDFIFNMIFWGLIVGIIGARLYYVIFNFDYYSEHLSEIYKIWNGGLAIHGGIIFGGLTILIYCKKYHVKVGKIFDMIVPALILAQAIGRWGNFFNHEAYGSLVSYQTLLKFKIIPQFIIDNMYINGGYHLPMFYFESLWCLLGFIIMLVIRRKKYIKCSQVTAFYLIWYGIARFFIETFRTDSLMISGFKVAKIVSILMIVIGLIIQFIQSRKPKLDELYNSVEQDEIRF